MRILRTVVLTLPVFFACAKPETPLSAGQSIGPAGGIVIVTTAQSAALAGVSLTIPPGALSETTTFTISASSISPLPTGTAIVGVAVEISPEQTTFAIPATIVLPFGSPAVFEVLAIDSSGVSRILTPDVSGTSVSFQTTSLGRFACLIRTLDAGVLDGGSETSDSGVPDSGLLETDVDAGDAGSQPSAGHFQCDAGAPINPPTVTECSAVSFATQVTYPVGMSAPHSDGGAYPVSVAVADFNGDGLLDLAVSNRGEDTISVLLNDGTGTFGAQAIYPGGTNPQGSAIGDFNGDDLPDLAVVTSQGFEVLLNEGDAGFGAPTVFVVGQEPSAIAVSDFNGDGRADVAVADLARREVDILLGDGHGAFSTPASYLTGPQPVALTVADFNGDCAPDLAVANMDTPTTGPGVPNSSVSVLLNQGDGTFGTTNYPVGGLPMAVATGDFNGDGLTDIAVANDYVGTLGILLNQGGTFGAQVIYPLSSSGFSLGVADFNGDGAPDIAVTPAGPNSLGVLVNQDGGTFPDETTFTAGPYPVAITVADVNGDGRPDLIAANANSSNVAVLLNNCDSP